MSDDIDPFATPGPSKGIVAGTSDDSSDPFAAPGPSSGIVNPRKSDALAGSALHTPAYATQELVKGIVNTPPQLAAIGDSFTSWLQSHMPSYFSAKAPETPESKALVEGMNKANSAQPLFPGAAEAVNAKLSTLQPQGVGEDYLGAGARGVGSAIASLPLTGGAAVLPQIAAGGGGGIASEAAEKLAPGTWWAPVVSGLAGGLTAGAGIHMMSNWAGLRAAKAAVESTAADLADAKAAQDQITANRTNSLLPDFDAKKAADDQFKQTQAEHTAARDTAIAASRQVQDDAIAAAKNQINQLKSSFDSTKTTPSSTLLELSDKYGSSIDEDAAGKIGQNNARNFLTPKTGTLATREAEAWQPLDAKLADAEPSLDNFKNAVEVIGGRGGALKDIVNQFSPNVAPRLKNALAKLEPDEIGEAIGEAPPVQPTWKDLRQARSAIGEALADPMLLKSVGRQNAEHLYGAITQDLSETADKAGLGDDFAKANNVSLSNRQFVEGPLAKLVSGPKPSPGSEPLPGEAVRNLLNQAKVSGENLSALRAEPTTSHFVDELASVVLTKASQDPSEWMGLSRGAREALVPDPADRTLIEKTITDNSAKSAHEAELARLSQVISAAKAAHNADKQQIKSAAQRAIDQARVQKEQLAQDIARRKLEAQTQAGQANLAVSRASAAHQVAREKLSSYSLAPSQHGINALLGADLGEHAGELAHHALGLTGVPHHLSALVGATVPAVIRFGKRVLTNPQNAVNSLVGGEAGAQGASNPLTGNRSQ